MKSCNCHHLKNISIKSYLHPPASPPHWPSHHCLHSLNAALYLWMTCVRWSWMVWRGGCSYSRGLMMMADLSTWHGHRVSYPLWGWKDKNGVWNFTRWSKAKLKLCIITFTWYNIREKLQWFAILNKNYNLLSILKLDIIIFAWYNTRAINNTIVLK